MNHKSNRKGLVDLKQVHEWQATDDRTNMQSGCPVCAGQKVLAGFNDLATLNPKLHRSGILPRTAI